MMMVVMMTTAGRFFAHQCVVESGRNWQNGEVWVGCVCVLWLVYHKRSVLLCVCVSGCLLLLRLAESRDGLTMRLAFYRDSTKSRVIAPI